MTFCVFACRDSCDGSNKQGWAETQFQGSRQILVLLHWQKAHRERGWSISILKYSILRGGYYLHSNETAQGAKAVRIKIKKQI